MSICTPCRLALRRTLLNSKHTRRLLTTKTTAASILATPTWSIRSLLPSSSTPTEPITPPQLHHLLRLAALPLPRTPAEETAMITTLQSQLQFVHAVQQVDTAGVEPLRAIRDEKEAESVGLEDLRGALEREVLVGHYQRPRRVREVVEDEAEKWDALSTARRTAGRYFVVKSGKNVTEGSG